MNTGCIWVKVNEVRLIVLGILKPFFVHSLKNTSWLPYDLKALLVLSKIASQSSKSQLNWPKPVLRTWEARTFRVSSKGDPFQLQSWILQLCRVGSVHYCFDAVHRSQLQSALSSESHLSTMTINHCLESRSNLKVATNLAVDDISRSMTVLWLDAIRDFGSSWCLTQRDATHSTSWRMTESKKTGQSWGRCLKRRFMTGCETRYCSDVFQRSQRREFQTTTAVIHCLSYY